MTPTTGVATAAPAFVDDAPAAGSQGFRYTGTWDHVSGENDGRRDGTSSRSYQIGATASFQFTGNRFALYGVRGPNGGSAMLRIDDSSIQVVSFYATGKRTAVIVYANTALTQGPHTIEIVVLPPPTADSKRRYVNLDGATFGSR